MINLSNPWLFPTPPTPTPFTQWGTNPPMTLVSTPNRPCPPPLIPHLPVFLITHLAREHHLQTHKPPPQNSPPPKRWKFKLQMSLSFQFHITLPKPLQPTRWKSKLKRSPPTLIIPVTPNYGLTK